MINKRRVHFSKFLHSLSLKTILATLLLKFTDLMLMVTLFNHIQYVTMWVVIINYTLFF